LTEETRNFEREKECLWQKFRERNEEYKKKETEKFKSRVEEFEKS
jgi:hypothetical protein